jgi:hypothetical protein
MLYRFAAVVLLVSSVAYADQPALPVDALVAQIESTHQTDVYLGKPAVQADIVVNFGGDELVSGRMWFTPAVGQTRLELRDGTVVVWDGQTAWVTPEAEANPMLRFHALTWPYFLALPHKMTEPGVNLASAGDLPSAGRRGPAVKMTFDAGVGDAPDDWYYVFADATGRVEAAAYIVTFSKSRAQAEAQPSIVLYDGYEAVEGVPMPTRWTFGYWDRASGMTQVKGRAELSGVAFVTPPAGAFDRPTGAVEVSAP